MAVNINEAVAKIKAAGSSNVRVVPMPRQNVMSGDFQIEVQGPDGWTPVLSGLKKAMAEDVVAQAFNRVILG